MTAVRVMTWLVLGALATSIAACGENYGGRQEVKGTVKLKGQPLDQGVIDFTPLEAQSTKSGALIRNGTYHIPRASGLMKGKYKVIITAGDGRIPESSDQAPGPSGSNFISKERIPADYNVSTKQEVEVKDKGPNIFDYDIP
jgi:hypothetical protein